MNLTRKTWILLYHALDAPTEPVVAENAADRSIVVEADRFREQLRCISSLGKSIVSLEDLFDPGTESTDREQVVITFDDGHRSNWSLAWPLLAEAGAVATFYVVAGFVDHDPEYLTSAQLRELASNNMLIGSHSMTHRFLPQLSPKDVHRELTDSRARLEDILGRPVLDLAIPGGHYNRFILEEARQCGYRSVATCRVGVYRQGVDSYRLPRLEVRRQLSANAFRMTFDRGKLLQLQVLEKAKGCLRSAIGLSGYTRLRRMAHRCLSITR